jgi:hypothetical protein
MAVAAARVIRVRVGDDGAFHGTPGVDEKLPGLAIQAVPAGDDQITHPFIPALRLSPPVSLSPIVRTAARESGFRVTSDEHLGSRP